MGFSDFPFISKAINAFILQGVLGAWISNLIDLPLSLPTATVIYLVLTSQIEGLSEQIKSSIGSLLSLKWTNFLLKVCSHFISKSCIFMGISGFNNPCSISSFRFGITWWPKAYTSCTTCTSLQSIFSNFICNYKLKFRN